MAGLVMKRFFQSASIILPLVLTACSLTPVASRVPGYLTTPKGTLLMSQDGQCWRTAEWRPALAIRQCDPEVVKKQEALKLAEEQAEEEKEEEQTEQVEVAEQESNTVPQPPVLEQLMPQKPAGLVLSPQEVKKGPDMREEVVFAPINLNSDTSFRFGDDRLTAEGRDAIIELAGLLKRRKVDDLKLTVVGHTDRIGSAAANMALSRRRAESIKKALVEEGIAAASIETGGMGAAMPITSMEDCPNNIERCELIDCLRPDRRVEIKARGKVQSGTRQVPVQGLLEFKMPQRPASISAERREELKAMCRA